MTKEQRRGGEAAPEVRGDTPPEGPGDASVGASREEGQAVVDAGPADDPGHEERTILERELADLSDRHLRLAAEFENYRKRTREELLTSGARAQASLVGGLLDAVDDLHRVTEVDGSPATLESVLEGVRLVERKLERALGDAGLEWLDPAGEPFDPERMEAVLRVPAQEEDEDDTVEQVFQRGVLFKGHLVRPARVTVRKLEE